MLDTIKTLWMEAQLPSAVLLIVTSISMWTLAKKSAAVRHLVWAVCLTVLLILPMALSLLPKWHLLPSADVLPAIDFPMPPIDPPLLSDNVMVPMALKTPILSEEMPVETAPPISWSMWAFMLWLVGASLLTFRLMLSRLALWRLSRHAAPQALAEIEPLREELGIRRAVRVLVSADPHMPMTWGTLSPTLLLPADFESWPDAKRRAVLLHELGHIRRHDALIGFIAQCSAVLHWMNPLTWIALWRLMVERERACDDLVIAHGTKASAYAEHLLDILQQHPSPTPAASIGMASPRGMAKRLEILLRSGLNRRQATFVNRLWIVAMGVLIAMPLIVLRAQEADPASTDAILDNSVIHLESAFTEGQSDVIEELERVVEIQGTPADSFRKGLQNSHRGKRYGYGAQRPR